MRPFVPAALATLVALVSPQLVGPARADDANFEFSKTTNPSGSWSYGWAPAPGAAFLPFATETNLGGGLSRWSAANGASLSLSCNSVANEPGVTMLGGVLGARLGSGGAATALRWTAPSSGNWHARATFVSEAGYFPLPSTSYLTGTQNVARFGASIAVGDVNGDGYADALVGQPNWTNGQTFEGRVALYLGGPSGPQVTPAWALESNQTSAHLGASVTMGDFNGDGYADFAICAPANGVSPSTLTLFKGSATTPTLALNYTGPATSGQDCVLGDLNGDGLADLAFLETSARTVAIWYGTTGAIAASPGFATIVNNLLLPTVLAAAGDVNGDGFGDLIIGAPADSLGTGAVRLEHGQAFGLAPGALLKGDAANAQFGGAVCAAGDVDGDGRGDVLVSSPQESVGGSNAGRVQIFRGGATGVGSTASWTAGGPPNSQTGTSLCGLRDLNGDGHADFAVGAPQYSNGQAGEGAAFVYYGGPAATATLHSTIEMDAAGALLGSALAAGDVNGDGLTDVAIGAPSFVTGGLTAGRVTLVMDPGPPPVPFARTSVRILADGVTLAQDTVDTATGRDTVTLELSLASLSGHTLDFEVSDAGGTPAREAVAMDVSIEPDATPFNPQGPALALGSQRFVPIQGPPAFDAAAFDPIVRKLASNGHLYDVCGDPYSIGPDGSGIAWDIVTRKFWNISFDAGNQRWVVSSWDTTSQTFTRVFDIPRVLSVPGTGADTLEDARGLALDSTCVYVVDAGPAGLQPAANAWFKFDRVGVPIASRKGDAFPANATGDIVDDCVYSPFASPTEPGRLLVAIEHVGILALDRDGALADSATWRSQGLPRASAPTAFAGLALDPVTGDLFLADNDRGQAQRWVRLDPVSPTSYLIGDNSPAVLISPISECTSSDALMWDPFTAKSAYCPPTPLAFGVAFRSADQRAYTIDYATGTLWKFDPRGGRGARVGETGLLSVWGLAYDAARDRLYGLQNAVSGGSQVWSIQPRTAAATALPQETPFAMRDIGFEPNGAAIYGVASTGSGMRLIRIDRDTGAGTVVGPTRDVAGLDWDPVRGALVGLSSGDSLWSINPGTGVASLIAKVPWSAGWEGLAVATVGVAGTADVPQPAGRGAAIALALAVTPQPSREHATLAFWLSEPARVRLDVYDVAGRHVRRLADGAFAPGAHTLGWDGREDSGATTSAGVYFARLAAAGRSTTGRIVRVR